MAHAPLVPAELGGAMAELDALIADHLAAKSAKTLSAYASDLRMFARFVGEADMMSAVGRFLKTPPGDAKRIALGWRKAMIQSGYAPATINRRLAALRNVVKMQDLGWTLDIEGIRLKTLRDTRGPGVAVIRDLLAVANADESILGYRDAAILQWLFYPALRRVEIVRLEVGDFTPGAKAMAMIWAKGAAQGDKAALAIDRRAARAADRWIEHMGRPRSGPLFIGTRGRKGRSRLDVATINRIVTLRAKQAGYARGRLPEPDPRPITPHGFRHTAITALIEAGGSFVEAQELARHRSPQTTQRYFDNIGAAVRDAQRQLPDLE